MPDFIFLKKGKGFGLGELREAAAELLKVGAGYPIWVLEGGMGAGKTTLVKALARELNMEEEVTSPTFSLVNQYNRPDGSAVYHFDFYRIKQETEAYDIGADEYFDSGNRCWIEWFEKIPSLLPNRYFHIKIEVTDADHRLISFRAYDGEKENRI